MANNPYINKVDYGGNTLIDLTGDTVTPADLTAGVTAHDRSGAPITGTRADIGDPVAIAHGGTGATTAAGALAGLGAAAQSDIAIIINGNQTTHTGGVAVGQYVIVRNSTISGITDGLYKATQAIPANTAITSAYLASVDGGGLNDVKDQITAIDVTSQVTFLNTSSVSNFNNITKFYKAGNVVTAFIALYNTVEFAVNSSTSIFSVPTALKPKQTGWIGFNAFLQNGGNGNMYSGHVYIASNNGTFYWRTMEAIPTNNSSVLVATLTWIV